MRTLFLALLLALPALAGDVTIDVKLVNAQMVQMWLTDWDKKGGDGQQLKLIRNLDIRGAMLDLTVNPENNVFAAPRVSTNYGQPAVFRLKDQLPVVSFNPVSGAFQEEQVDLGVDLRVTPRPVQPGLIFLSLKAEVRRLDELASNQYAATTEQTLEESLELPNGNSLMLAGGILGEPDRVNAKLFPILGDLPQLGPLFTYAPRAAAVVITPIFR